MGNVSKDEAGYSVVEVVLLAVIVLVIAFVGWYVYKASNNAYDTYNSAPSSNVAPKVKKGVTPVEPAKKPAASTSSTSSTTTSTSTAPKQ